MQGQEIAEQIPRLKPSLPKETAPVRRSYESFEQRPTDACEPGAAQPDPIEEVPKCSIVTALVGIQLVVRGSVRGFSIAGQSRSKPDCRLDFVCVQRSIEEPKFHGLFIASREGPVVQIEGVVPLVTERVRGHSSQLPY